MYIKEFAFQNQQQESGNPDNTFGVRPTYKNRIDSY